MTPLHRVDLVAAVATRLEEQVLAGRLVAGESLPPEGTLSRQLGVSRTVIREAMRILQARGLVEVSQGRPPRVKPADPAQVFASITAFLQRANQPLADLVEVRRHLETAIAGLAAQRATPEQIAALDAANHELTAAQNLEQRIEADVRFHTLLAEATGNPVFGLLLEPLTHLLRLSLRETLSRTGAGCAADCHEKILDAIRAHDEAAARQAMLNLVDTAEQSLEAVAPTEPAAHAPPQE